MRMEGLRIRLGAQGPGLIWSLVGGFTGGMLGGREDFGGREVVLVPGILNG